MSSTPAAKAYVGCSGWSYRHWKGPFYGPELPASQWFSHYARRFGTVELNNTFYRLPPAATFATWAAKAPPGFVYAVKVNRFGTHRLKLRDPQRWLPTYLERVALLGSALGPNLVQLPPRWKRDLGRLGDFLEAATSAPAIAATSATPAIAATSATPATAATSAPAIAATSATPATAATWAPRATAGRGTPASPAIGRGRPLLWALEFRDPSWLHESTYELLREYRVALCCHDLVEDHPWALTTSWGYARFHGPHAKSEKYAGEYGTEGVAALGRPLLAWLEQGCPVYAYFNNDLGGAAVRDAQALAELLTLR
ncbi:MAG: DUF72 domain-containing protein [Acidimicrobiales bacterium]